MFRVRWADTAATVQPNCQIGNLNFWRKTKQNITTEGMTQTVVGAITSNLTGLSLDLQLDLGEVDWAGHDQLGGPAGASRPEDLPVGRFHRMLTARDSSPMRVCRLLSRSFARLQQIIHILNDPLCL